MPGFDVMPAEFRGFFTFIVTVIVLGFIYVIISAVRGAVIFKRSGVDVLAPGADLLGRLANSDLLQPSAHGSVENRLAKLDALLDAGDITQAEHDAARKHILENL